MRASGTALLQEKGRTLKFVLNGSAILFFLVLSRFAKLLAK